MHRLCSRPARAASSRVRRALLTVVLTLGCDGFAQVGVIARDAGTNDAAARDGAVARDAAVARTIVDDCADDNPAGLSATRTAALKNASASAPGQRYLYPYDGTVFPAGMGAPTLMWEGPAADAVLVSLESERLSYTGCLPLDAQGRVTLPDDAWTSAGRLSGGARDPVRVRLSTIAGDAASGPIEQTIVIAPDATQATLYVMSYSDTLLPSVLRLRAGRPAEALFSPLDCTGCHAVTADGTSALAYLRGTGAAFRLPKDGSAPAPLASAREGAELGALHPSGELYVANAHPGGAGTRAYAPQVMTAALYDVATGARIANSGLPAGVMLPAFSPSGARLVFDDYAIAGGRGLALMRFDASARVASDYALLFRDDDGYPGWASFLPNEDTVVFARGRSADYSSQRAGFLGGPSLGSPSDLHAIDLTDQTVRPLARANGLPSADSTDDQTYLPSGVGDLHQNYHPHVAPVASSEYAWVYFDSFRTYGNQGRRRQDLGRGHLARARPPRSEPPAVLRRRTGPDAGEPSRAGHGSVDSSGARPRRTVRRRLGMREARGR